jgi:hypothetical protein
VCPLRHLQDYPHICAGSIFTTILESVVIPSLQTEAQELRAVRHTNPGALAIVCAHNPYTSNMTEDTIEKSKP